MTKQGYQCMSSNNWKIKAWIEKHKSLNTTMWSFFDLVVVIIYQLWIFFFCLGFLSYDIHDSLDNRGRRSFLIPLYHFHPLHEHLHTGQVITAGISPLCMVSNRELWLPSLTTNLRAQSLIKPYLNYANTV